MTNSGLKRSTSRRANLIRVVLCSALFAAPVGAAKLDGDVGYDTMLDTRVSNALAPNVTAPNSYALHASLKLAHDSLLIEGRESHYLYDHPANTPASSCTTGTGCNTVVGSDPTYRYGICPGDPGCVTVIGHTAYEAGPTASGQVYVPAHAENDIDDEVHVAVQTAYKRVYVGVGGFQRRTSYAGYPRISGVGGGISVTSNPNARFSGYGSVYYYPKVSGKYIGATSVQLGALSGASFSSAYGVTTYQVGAKYQPASTPAYVAIHLSGDRSTAKDDSPITTRHTSIGITFGLHI